MEITDRSNNLHSNNFPVLTDIVDRVLANCLGIVYMETHNCIILGQRAIDLDILLSQHDQHKYFPFLPGAPKYPFRPRCRRTVGATYREV